MVYGLTIFKKKNRRNTSNDYIYRSSMRKTFSIEYNNIPIKTHIHLI